MMVGVIMTRTLKRDLTRYNRVPTEEEKAEAAEETGWKLVHADVFRPPSRFPMLFAVCVGTGVQILSMGTLTLLFAAIGFLSPANRGGLMIALLVLFVLMGVFAGYAAARVHKMFKGTQWQRCTLLTATLYPGSVFGIVIFLNFFVLGYGSAGAIKFTSMLAVMALWFGVSVPLVFLGAFAGFKRDAITFPVAISSMPRQIPDQAWWMHPLLTILVGGVLPFGAMFAELFFILQSLWLDQYYYVFGFLLIVCFIVVVTCAEMSIVLCYFQLVAEDYRWWWRSFLTSGAAAFYLFGYSVLYFFAWLDVTLFTSTLLYFGYMVIISSLFFMMTGVIGTLSCFIFTRAIYASIKID
jgi:transmembrane 9 superfamily protein 2/4